MKRTIKRTKTVPVKKLLADGYHKCPSVMTGGKTWFYVKRDPITDTKYTVVWDRIDCIWCWTEEPNERWQEIHKT